MIYYDCWHNTLLTNKLSPFHIKNCIADLMTMFKKKSFYYLIKGITKIYIYISSAIYNNGYHNIQTINFIKFYKSGAIINKVVKTRFLILNIKFAYNKAIYKSIDILILSNFNLSILRQYKKGIFTYSC